MADNKKMTISQATMEVVLTDPKIRKGEGFTVSKVKGQVDELLGREIRTNVISNYISGSWVKKGIIKKLGKKDKKIQYALKESGVPVLERLRKNSRSFKKTKTVDPGPVLPDQVDSVTIGNAIVDHIVELKINIRRLQEKLTDKDTRHRKDIAAFRQQLKGKDGTIQELKGTIEKYKRAQGARNRTMPMSDLTTFTSRPK